ncbi:MAG: alternative ribosome rescue aminoacyl-tRNA hydrolase ArfB [Planctomycetota bacterium]|jgi:ribosome-associated protein|nr:alternative ribosome rescue aminoacyl-tRNA hydrolase ArfB [Planctomycetota bacterium]
MFTIRLNSGHEIPETELIEFFSRSSGPGGQHVNKVETRVELRFNPGLSRAFDETVRQRIVGRLEGQLDSEGFLRVVSQEFRSQRKNRRTCRMRLKSILNAAAIPEKRRLPTRPTRASRERRLNDKRHQSFKKKNRRSFGQE